MCHDLHDHDMSSYHDPVTFREKQKCVMAEGDLCIYSVASSCSLKEAAGFREASSCIAHAAMQAWKHIALHTLERGRTRSQRKTEK